MKGNHPSEYHVISREHYQCGLNKFNAGNMYIFLVGHAHAFPGDWCIYLSTLADHSRDPEFKSHFYNPKFFFTTDDDFLVFDLLILYCTIFYFGVKLATCHSG